MKISTLFPQLATALLLFLGSPIQAQGERPITVFKSVSKDKTTLSITRETALSLPLSAEVENDAKEWLKTQREGTKVGFSDRRYIYVLSQTLPDGKTNQKLRTYQIGFFSGGYLSQGLTFLDVLVDSQNLRLLYQEPSEKTFILNEKLQPPPEITGSPKGEFLFYDRSARGVVASGKLSDDPDNGLRATLVMADSSELIFKFVEGKWVKQPPTPIVIPQPKTIEVQVTTWDKKPLSPLVQKAVEKLKKIANLLYREPTPLVSIYMEEKTLYDDRVFLLTFESGNTQRMRLTKKFIWWDWRNS